MTLVAEAVRLGARTMSMDMAVEDLADGAAKIVLRGRFDTTNAVMAEVPFNTVATEKRAMVVDMTDVSFLASYGVRVLLVGAKVLEAKGGKLVIVCPDNNVAKVLKAAGTSAVIPIFQDERAAVAAIGEA